MTEVAQRECGGCGWVYDPALGDDEARLPVGVAFGDLPEGFACPRCMKPRSGFLRPSPPMEEPVGRLVRAYRGIDLRMRDLPIYNATLSVEAVGFRRAGNVLVGALITPWFLNIVILGRPQLPPEGESVELMFPGGRFVAVAATPEDAAHLAIRLMSPMKGVPDQDGARAVAEESLRLVLSPHPAARAAETPKTTAAEAPKGVAQCGLPDELVDRG
jgi:[NiFe] hydrogenase assembly HybE family chaperone